MLALVTTAGREGPLEVVDVPEPQPAPHEVVVRVRAASLNRGELRLVASRPDGWRPGQDVAGTVAVAAADGTGPAVGTRVVAWADQPGWAERVAVPADLAVALPAHVEPSTAATLPVAGVTALRAVRRGEQLLGRRVLVTGASGAVGRFAVELAARSGGEVTAVTSRADEVTDLMSVGAAHVVGSPSEAGGRFALILESIGGSVLEAVPPLLDDDGVLVLFGTSSAEPSRLSFADFRGSPNCRIELLRVYGRGERRTRGADLRSVVELVASGSLTPRIGATYPFGRANEALRALRAREVRGKAVLLFDGS